MMIDDVIARAAQKLACDNGPSRDQDATKFRLQIETVLDGRELTDDVLVGIALGGWALVGSLRSAVEAGLLSTEAANLAGHLSNNQGAFVHTMREGQAASEALRGLAA